MNSRSVELLGTQVQLPEFEKPPVTEVVLSVQFEPLQRLKGPQVGLLWGRFRQQFPNSEEHPPLPPVVELFGVPTADRVQFELMDSMPTPRTWFLTERGDQLIQVQQDRFVHNWRKVDDGDAYPRYDHLVALFREELGTFREFLEQERIGELVFSQCEVTYVNYIQVSDSWNIHEEMEKCLTVWAGKYSDAFLQKPEDSRLAIRYIIPSSNETTLGRLHVAVNPAFRVADKKPVLVLTLTARSRPVDSGLDGVHSALDLGREWVVRGFTSITTPYMHEIWERRR